MKIFSIKHNKMGYDYFSGHIIVANDEIEVRQIAKKCSADEGIGAWDAAAVTIEGEYTGEKKEPFMLLSSFHAG